MSLIDNYSIPQTRVLAWSSRPNVHGLVILLPFQYLEQAPRVDVTLLRSQTCVFNSTNTGTVSLAGTNRPAKKYTTEIYRLGLQDNALRGDRGDKINDL